ncbi:MAG: MarR family transcriptional regulator [Alphaproteobacteria bacterium]|nr:MarR family transcriptional regulator [Alphaproteobacteria bacterium]
MSESPATPDAIYEALLQIAIIDQLASTAFERVLPDGLKLSQFGLLSHLSRMGGQWSPARLANAMQVTRGAITNTIHRLEKRGLVAIEADPSDGRGKLVSITPAGTRMQKKAVETALPHFAFLSERFSQADMMTALPFLNALRESLDRARD